tara:strand:- start:377 stop:751 length:375 start_codon:yes stop_codon:yes gene_type:complete
MRLLNIFRGSYPWRADEKKEDEESKLDKVRFSNKSERGAFAWRNQGDGTYASEGRPSGKPPERKESNVYHNQPLFHQEADWEIYSQGSDTDTMALAGTQGKNPSRRIEDRQVDGVCPVCGTRIE